MVAYWFQHLVSGGRKKISMSLRPAWSTRFVPDQPGLYAKTPCPKGLGLGRQLSGPSAYCAWLTTWTQIHRAHKQAILTEWPFGVLHGPWGDGRKDGRAVYTKVTNERDLASNKVKGKAYHPWLWGKSSKMPRRGTVASSHCLKDASGQTT